MKQEWIKRSAELRQWVLVDSRFGRELERAQVVAAERKASLMEKLRNWSKEVVIHRGDTTVTLYDFVSKFKQEFDKDDLIVSAKSIAYDFFLSIFPGIIFLFTLLPYIPLENAQGKVLKEIEKGFGGQGQLYDTLHTTIMDITSKPREGLMSFGFLIALWSTTNGMVALMEGFNKCYNTKETRGFVKTRIIAVLMLFLMVLVLLVGMLSLVFGKVIINFLVEQTGISMGQATMINLLQIASYVFIVFGAISVLFYLGPTVKQRWRFFSVGSAIATALSIGINLGFSYYVNNFASYNAVYGSIGSIIVMMLWLQLMSLSLLMGFEINAVMDEVKGLKRIRQKHQFDGDIE